MTLDLLSLTDIKPFFEKIEKELNALKENKIEIPEWCTDEVCNNLKFGKEHSLSSYRKHRFYACKGGIEDAFVFGRKVWRRESVLEWLPLTDAELPEYHKKYKTGATK